MNRMSPLDAQADGLMHVMLRQRHSVRHFQAEIPGQDVLDRIFTSVAAAPSAHNRQPWRFAVILDHEIKTRLARNMGARLAADRRRDGDQDSVIRGDVDKSFDRITGAPVVIIVAMSMQEMVLSS